MQHLARAALPVLLASGCAIELSIDGVETTSSGSGSGATTGATVDLPTGTTDIDETTTDATTTDDSTTGAVACVPPTVAPGEPLFVVPAGGMGHHHVAAVASGEAGETYIAGYFTDTLALLDASVDGGDGPAAAFVARLDCAGALEWLSVGRTIDAGARSRGLAIALHAGRVYVGGELTGVVDFTSGSIAGGTDDAFIAGFDATDGTLQTSVVLAGETDSIRSLAISDTGTIFAAGGCRAGASTGILLATWNGQDPTAAHDCAYTEDSTIATVAHSVVLLADGSPVIGGQLTGPIDGMHDPMIVGASSRGFVAKPGVPLNLADPYTDGWSITFGEDVFTGNRVNALAVFGDNVVVAARGTGLTQVLGSNNPLCDADDCVDPESKFNTAVALLNPVDGACADMTVLCSTSVPAEEIWDVAASADKIYVTGQFEGMLLHEDGAIVPAAQGTTVRMFVLALESDLSRPLDAWTVLSDAEGDTECGVADTDTGGDPRTIIRGSAIAAGPDGVVVGGSVCGQGVSLGGVSLTPNLMSHDGFVTRLAR